MFSRIKILAALLALTVFLGCNEKKKDEEGTESEIKIENTNVKPKAPRPEKAAATNFTGDGVWVSKKYTDKLLATKSPKKSQDATPITMMILPNALHKDATVVLEFHEGGTGKLVKKNNGYEIQSKKEDGPSHAFQYVKGGLKTKNDEFIKLKFKGNKNDYKVAEQLLFAGKYDLDGKQVEFTPNGKVTGLDSFSYYSVLIDYYDAGMQVDQIRLGKSYEDSELYGFKFKNDKLLIYELKCTDGDGKYCNVVKYGKRLYKLEKKN